MITSTQKCQYSEISANLAFDIFSKKNCIIISMMLIKEKSTAPIYKAFAKNSYSVAPNSYLVFVYYPLFD